MISALVVVLALLGAVFLLGIAAGFTVVFIVAVADYFSEKVTGHGVLADPVTGERHVRQPAMPSLEDELDEIAMHLQRRRS